MPRNKVPNMSSRLIGRGDNKVTIYRWNIGPALRKRGYKAIDLWEDGKPFSIDDARDHGFKSIIYVRNKGRTPSNYKEAAKLIRLLTKQAKEEIKNTKGTAIPARQLVVAKPIRGTVSELLDDYLSDCTKKSASGKLKPKTLRTYINEATPVRKALGAVAPLDLTARTIMDLREAIDMECGEHMGHHATHMLLRAIRWGRKQYQWKGYLPDRDETEDLQLSRPGARLRVGTPTEMDTLYRAFMDLSLIHI